jgi:hypothetical protein
LSEKSYHLAWPPSELATLRNIVTSYRFLKVDPKLLSRRLFIT